MIFVAIIAAIAWCRATPLHPLSNLIFVVSPKAGAESDEFRGKSLAQTSKKPA
jgi:hypothetical protein